MSINYAETADRLGELEDKLRELRLTVGSLSSVVNALETLGDQPEPYDMDLGQGYTALCDELGVFLPDGQALLKVRHNPKGYGYTLRVVPIPGQELPSKILLQVNVPYVEQRGKNTLELQALWHGEHSADPSVALQFIGTAGPLKTEQVPCKVRARTGGFELRAPARFGAALSRSESLTEVQVVLTFDTSIMDAALTVLKVL